MVRPVKTKTRTDHLLVLTRMLKQIELDETMDTRKKNRVTRKLGDLMTEFQASAVA